MGRREGEGQGRWAGPGPGPFPATPRWADLLCTRAAVGDGRGLSPQSPPDHSPTLTGHSPPQVQMT